MKETNSQIHTFVNKTYQHGFVTDIESDVIKPGLNEDVVRIISQKKMNLNLCWNGG